ncbi:MAG: ABC transporter permease, partial [Stackebrandtia sp.]
MWTQIRAGTILLGGALRGVAQYRADLGFAVAAGAAYQTIGFLTVWVILARFETIAGWGMPEMALMYGMRLCSHALWVIPFNQLVYLTDRIRHGEFDRFLVRPANPLIQLMTTRINIATFGDLLGGVTILGVALTLVDVDWNAWRVGFAALALLGGAGAEVGVQLALSSLAFRFVKVDETRFIADGVFSEFGNYPAKIFGTAGQWTLTAVIPVVFVAYLPTSVLLDRVDDTGLPAALAYASPAVGALVAAAG